MSYNAERWARMQKAGNSRAKQVLIELAHCLNSETGLCCPSIAFLHEITELKEDTIMSAIKHLEGAGLVRKKRVGYKNRYQLVGFDPKKDYPENGVNLAPENGVYPENGGVSQERGIDTPENGVSLAPENGVYPENGGVSQERGIDTPENGVSLAPENGVLTGNKQGNNKECSFVHACDSAACPTVEDIPADVFGPDPDISNPPAELPPAKEKEKPAKKKRGYRCEVERPADVDPQLWTDFIKNRQTKKCPVTQTLLRRYAEKGKLCGMSLSQVLTTIIERNWQGFEPAWLQKEQEGRACFKATPERTAAPSYFSVTKPVPQPVDDGGAHELFKGLLA